MKQLRFYTLCVSVIAQCVAFSFPIDVAESPTNDLTLSLSAINSAQKSIYMNAYELTSDDIAQALMSKIKSGVHVEILQEGQPVPHLSAKGKIVLDEIVKAMNDNSNTSTLRYFLMTSEANSSGFRRYKYDHAKYIVVDEQELLIGSENYSDTGNPEPGEEGTRGWETLVHDSGTAAQFLSIFHKDAVTTQGDVKQLVNAGSVSFLPGASMVSGFMSPHCEPVRDDSPQPQTMNVDHLEELTSPDTSLNGVVGFIKSATTSLDLELMTFSSKWGHTGKMSPLLQAVLDAAKRGVHVRVLLNDEKAFATNGGGGDGGVDLDRSASSHSHSSHHSTSASHSSEPSQNEKTVEILKNGGAEAMIADVKAMGVRYIHNKGALADGNKALISSINWNQNSVENNREAAISITGNDTYNHYETLFQSDWDATLGSHNK